MKRIKLNISRQQLLAAKRLGVLQHVVTQLRRRYGVPPGVRFRPS